jgi:heptosyltransferase-2
MMHELKMEEYDFIIDLHHNFQTMRLKKELGVKSFSYNKFAIRKWIYTNLKWNLMPKKHLVDRYMETVESFGIKNDGEGLDYFIPEKDETHLKDIPVSHHAGYIGIVIGASHFTKKMPVEKLKELSRKINHPIILMGGKEDMITGNEIASVDEVKIYNACGKFNLNESADLVKKSKLIMTHDTGLMHIAAAFKRPIISVWGNTVPEFGMSPYYGNIQIPNSKFQISHLRCRPCIISGYDKCPKGHFNCMNKINTDSILETIRIFLQ